jgi:hypothetical protein
VNAVDSATIPQADGLASASVNGVVYEIGGADTAASSTNPHLSTVEAYAPATNS